MFRRLFWLMVGVGFGFGTSFWFMRFMRETAARYAPERFTADLAGAVKSFGTDLKLAVADGREGMRQREAELRAELREPAEGGPPNHR
jgi:hypothetical protein